MSGVTIEVVVPTYRRPLQLERCLRALRDQTRAPDRILVVARADDSLAHRVVEAAAVELKIVELVTVHTSGVIAAMSAGVAASRADIIAFTDDDAAPRREWVERLLRHFDDPSVGGVGGRDVIPGQEAPLTAVVGVFNRSGRLVGNHHLGSGPARDVDVLKGVNMAFRSPALALPAPQVLRGSGAQVDFEVLSCAFARASGWRVVYDPAVVVDHEGAAREGPDRRMRPDVSAVFDAAFNSVVAVCALERKDAVRRAGFGLLVGTSDRPGIGRALVALARREHEVLRRVGAAVAGRISAVLWLLSRILRARSLVVVTTSALRDRSHANPRVALVAHDIHDNGGMERACAELLRHAHSEVAFVVVAAQLAPELRPFVEAWVRVRVPARPFPLKFVAFFLRAGRVLTLLDVDLIHTVGAIVPNRVDVAAIHFCHAGHRTRTGRLAPERAPILRRVNTAFARALALLAERWCYRTARLRAFAAVSEGVAGEVEDHYGGVPVMVTPNGVETARFRPDPAARVALRTAQAAGDGCCVALFVGGDWHRKGLALALEGVAKARSEGADVRLWVVGAGDIARFRAAASALGITDSVSFFGARPDTERYYQAADLFVLPSSYETFSMVCYEAAASGLPLIIPRIHGAVDLVGADEGGLLVERTAADIAAALVVLAEDSPRRFALGAEARRRAQGSTWDASAASIVRLYRSLVAEDNK